MGGEERQRLSGTDSGWKTWGPYLSERAWGTVREDYSEHGDAWDHVSHDDARSRAFRWSEDGLGGICDASQVLCLAFAFWNGADPILKERIFGLTGTQGNHGEDAKEYWWYLDSTPTHSWMRWRYRYAQAAFPYQDLIDENRRRGKQAPEYELVDTGVFDGDRYFDVTADYAKPAADPECGSRGGRHRRAAHPVVSQHLVLGGPRWPGGPPADDRTCERRPRGRTSQPGPDGAHG